jgi:hypothetical protein
MGMRVGIRPGIAHKSGRVADTRQLPAAGKLRFPALQEGCHLQARRQYSTPLIYTLLIYMHVEYCPIKPAAHDTPARKSKLRFQLCS